MNMARRAAPLAAITVILALVAACGGESGTATMSPSPTTVTTTTTEREAWITEVTVTVTVPPLTSEESSSAPIETSTPPPDPTTTQERTEDDYVIFLREEPDPSGTAIDWLRPESDGFACKGTATFLEPGVEGAKVGDDHMVSYLVEADGRANQSKLLVLYPGAWLQGVIIGNQYASFPESSRFENSYYLSAWILKSDFLGWDQQIVLCTG